MSEVATRPGARRLWPLAVLLAAVLVAGGVGIAIYRAGPRDEGKPTEVASREVSEAKVKEFCGACHGFPPPDSFPRSV